MQTAKSAIRALKAKQFLALLLLCCGVQADASPLFANDAFLDVTLSGPVDTLIKQDEIRRELPFVLEADGVRHAVEIRVRGKSRIELCDFPPLRIRFSAGDTAGSVFAGQDKLKLVTHCKGHDSAQDNVLEEYAAYRIFNVLSDVGYRVRLLRVTYAETGAGGRQKPFARYGFVIESADELAERVGGTPVELEGVTLRKLNQRHASTVYVFHYLIGNTDWSLVTADGDDFCCHNGDLFEIGGEIFVVPYDFDLSGLVNARYAKPHPDVRISRVTQRRYRGYCISSGALAESLSTISAKKQEILDIVARLPALSQKEIAVKTRFLERFFDKANDQAKLIRRFENRCL